MQFEEGHLPLIHNACASRAKGSMFQSRIDIVAEVEQHLGEGRVRAVAMKPTEGLVRGMKAEDLGEPISVPVGRGTLGRVLNVLGEPVDKLGPVKYEKRYPIHRPAPVARRPVHQPRNVRDGHQGRRPDRAVPQGRQDRPVRRRGRRQDGADSGADPQRRHEARRRVRLRRRRRAHARRQRPLARIPGIGRHRGRAIRKNRVAR